MNKKQLAIKLSKLKKLEKFNVKLEQYETDSNFASDLLWLALGSGDIRNKVVADFGCGSGILGIGALLLGAKFVYFLDVDEDALEVVKGNLKLFYFRNYKLINSNVVDFDINIDTIVMNPPFGVQNRKADKIFLQVAMGHSDSIYSIHKIESKNFIDKLSKEFDFRVLNVHKKVFTIKKSYRFHTKEKHSLDVGIWAIKSNV